MLLLSTESQGREGCRDWDPQKQTLGDREGRGEGNREEKGVQGWGQKGRQVSTEQETARWDRRRDEAIGVARSLSQ